VRPADSNGSIILRLHLAAAQAFGDDINAVITYDARMTAAADVVGLRVEAPR